MKFLKPLAILFIAVSIISCGSDDDSTPSVELSSATISGSYSLTELVGEEEVSVTLNSSGAEVEETLTTSVGSSLATVTIALAADNTFEITGSYVLTEEVTVDGDMEDALEGVIILLDDSGEYTLDTDEDTITFNSVDQQLLEGTYDFDFDEDTIELVQSSSIGDESETTTTTTSTSDFRYTLVR